MWHDPRDKRGRETRDVLCEYGQIWWEGHAVVNLHYLLRARSPEILQRRRICSAVKEKYTVNEGLCELVARTCLGVETHHAGLSSTGLVSRDGRGMNGGHGSKLLAHTWGPAWV